MLQPDFGGEWREFRLALSLFPYQQPQTLRVIQSRMVTELSPLADLAVSLFRYFALSLIRLFAHSLLHGVLCVKSWTMHQGSQVRLMINRPMFSLHCRKCRIKCALLRTRQARLACTTLDVDSRCNSGDDQDMYARSSSQF